MIVGDRLIIELDGRAFHSAGDFENDRKQDLELALRGYLVVRLSYRMVVLDWDSTHRSVRELVARGLHRWNRSVRELGAFFPLRWYQIASRRIIERGAGLGDVVVPMLAMVGLFAVLLFAIRRVMRPRLG